MRRFPIILSIVLVLLVGLVAVAEENPEETYKNFQKAVQTGKPDKIMKFYPATPVGGPKLKKEQIENLCKALKLNAPKTFKLTKKKEGKYSTTLWFEGTIMDPGTKKERTGYGKVGMVKTGDGEWKIISETWCPEPIPEPTETPDMQKPGNIPEKITVPSQKASPKPTK